MSFQESVNLLSEWGPRERIYGNTGFLDANGNVHSDPTYGLATNYIWVRPRGERNAIAVLNLNVTTQRANIPVILEMMDNGEYQVLQVEPKDASFTYGVFASGLNMPDKPAEQEKSPVWHRRISDLRLRKDSAGGLNLYVNKGVYRKADGTLENFDGGPIDLTASLPGTADTKRIVLVGLDGSNALTQSATTAIDAGTSPTTEPYFTLSDFVDAANAASTSTTWLWAAPLLNGQTEFLNTDSFIDLRPIMRAVGTLPIAQGGTGAITATAAFNALSPLTTKGDLLGNNGTDDIRLAVGTNGQVLIADSAAASGLAWSSVPATLEATLTTNDATPTVLISYAVAVTTAATIRGRFIAAKSDKSAAAGGFFRVTFRRTAAGNVTLVGAGYLEEEHDSSGSPVLTFAVDVGTQTGRILWTGLALEQWSVKVNYEVVSV